MPPPPSPPSSSGPVPPSVLRGRVVAGVVALICLLGSLVSGGGPAVAQTAPTAGVTTTSSTTVAPLPVAASTTTQAPSTTTTTVAPTTTTVTRPTTTTTTVAPAPWVVKVPGPPPAPVVDATAAEVALATTLERQIATQSDVLDVLAETYDRAQQKVVAAGVALDAVQARLATARAEDDAAQAASAQADRTMRSVAVAAYVNIGAGAPTGRGALLGTYERGTAQTDAETAVGKALSQLQSLHQAEQRLRAAEAEIGKEEQQASDAKTAAQAAAAQAQAAAQAATTQQQQLLSTVAQVSGNLAPLVAAARAAQAQAAFSRFSTAGLLDFQPSSALAGPATQAAAVVQLAVAQVGKPYVWGAAGPDSFDCSGLVTWAWGRVGVAVPRVAADQQTWATPVPISQLAPGDLVFFGNPAHHVGIYVGGGLMVDAPHSGASVSVVSIWWDDLAGFGRVHHP
jgi:peptidoglycan DL-endopeptidase CwlO